MEIFDMDYKIYSEKEEEDIMLIIFHKVAVDIINIIGQTKTKSEIMHYCFNHLAYYGNYIIDYLVKEKQYHPKQAYEFSGYLLSQFLKSFDTNNELNQLLNSKK